MAENCFHELVTISSPTFLGHIFGREGWINEHLSISVKMVKRQRIGNETMVSTLRAPFNRKASPASPLQWRGRAEREETATGHMLALHRVLLHHFTVWLRKHAWVASNPNCLLLNPNCILLQMRSAQKAAGGDRMRQNEILECCSLWGIEWLVMESHRPLWL